MKTMTDLLGNTFTYDKTIKYAILNKINDKTLDVSKMYSMTQLSYMSSNSIRDYTGEVMIMKHFEKFINGGNGNKRECIKSMAKVLQYFFDNSISKKITSDEEVLSDKDIKIALVNKINDVIYDLDMLIIDKCDSVRKLVSVVFREGTHSNRRTSESTHLKYNDSILEYKEAHSVNEIMSDVTMLRQVIVALYKNTGISDDYNSHWFNHHVSVLLKDVGCPLGDDEFTIVNMMDLSDMNKYM